LRLDRGDVRVHQAFEQVQPDGAYTLRWRIDRRGYCLELEGQRTCGRGFTVGDTWSLLLALDWGSDERTVLQALWLFTLFMPIGVPTLRHTDLAAGGALASAMLIVGPLLLGFAVTPVHQLIAIWGGLLAGRRFSRTGRATRRITVS